MTEIISVDASTASQSRLGVRDGATGLPSGARAAMGVGTVKWYNANKGFGYRPGSGRPGCLSYASVLERAGIMGTAEGQRVAIDVAQGRKGPEAVGLRLI